MSDVKDEQPQIADRFSMVEMEDHASSKRKLLVKPDRMSAVFGEESPSEEAAVLRSVSSILQRLRRSVSKSDAESQSLMAISATFDRDVADHKKRWDEAVAPFDIRIAEIDAQLAAMAAQKASVEKDRWEVYFKYYNEHNEITNAQHRSCGSKLAAIKSSKQRFAVLNNYLTAVEMQAKGWLVDTATSRHGVSVKLGYHLSKSGSYRRYRRRASPKQIMDLVLRPSGVYAMFAPHIRNADPGQPVGKYVKVIDVMLLDTIVMVDGRVACGARPQTEVSMALGSHSYEVEIQRPAPCTNHPAEKPFVATRWCSLCGSPVLWVCEADPTHFVKASKCRCVRSATKWVAPTDHMSYQIKFEVPA